MTCAYSNKKILEDESTKSDLTGKIIAASLSQTSAISGRKGEPTFFDQCEFTSVVVLKDELLTSEISGKKYRFDEQLSSSVSGRKGYHQEFIKCFVTGNPLLQSEAEKCEVTGQLVMPGILERCEVTKKMVLPCELAKSAFSGKKALKRFMVTSSVAGASLLESEAIISSDGKYCIPLETQTCLWSGGSHHPDDMRVCHLTGGTYFKSYVTTDTPPRLAALVGLLDGTSRKADAADLWPEIVRGLSPSIGGTLRIEATELSPNGNHLAVCIEVTKWLIMTRQVGMLYSVQDKKPIGRVVSGKRNYFRWSNESGF